MTGLKITSNNTALATYTPPVPALTDNRYVSALVISADNRPLYALADNEKASLILDCISAANLIGGWNVKDDSEVMFFVQALLPDLKTRYMSFTQTEVRNAFEFEAKGLYGDTIGLSVRSAIKWLDSYAADNARRDAKSKLQAAVQPKPLPRVLSRQKRRDLINRAYVMFQQANNYNDLGNFIYKLLDSEGLIPYTPEEKTAYLERGRVLVFNRLQVYRNLDEKRENEKKLDRLAEDDTEPIIEAKKMALNEYFASKKALGFTHLIFCQTCPKL